MRSFSVIIGVAMAMATAFPAVAGACHHPKPKRVAVAKPKVCTNCNKNVAKPAVAKPAPQPQPQTQTVYRDRVVVEHQPAPIQFVGMDWGNTSLTTGPGFALQQQPARVESYSTNVGFDFSSRVNINGQPVGNGNGNNNFIPTTRPPNNNPGENNNFNAVTLGTDGGQIAPPQSLDFIGGRSDSRPLNPPIINQPFFSGGGVRNDNDLDGPRFGGNFGFSQNVDSDRFNGLNGLPGTFGANGVFIAPLQNSSGQVINNTGSTLTFQGQGANNLDAPVARSIIGQTTIDNGVVDNFGFETQRPTGN